jgi:hypothetical protein
MNYLLPICQLLLFLGFASCKANSNPSPDLGTFQLVAARFGSVILDVSNGSTNTNVPADVPLTLEFSTVLDTNKAKTNIQLLGEGNQSISSSYSFPDENRSVSMQPVPSLVPGKEYSIDLKSGLSGKNGETFPGTQIGFTVSKGTVLRDSMRIDNQKILPGARIADVGPRPSIQIWFSIPLKESSLGGNTFTLNSKFGLVSMSQTLSSDKKYLVLTPQSDLKSFVKYTFQINNTLEGAQGQTFAAKTQEFYTKLDLVDKFPLISDEELMTKVQQQTMKYFYDFGHPVSGLAPERNATPNVVTSGGSGFGLMALIVGVERGFITRQQGVERWLKIVNFLKTADRFHGVWPHWLNGTTGKTIPFSANDDGGDLVETAFLVQGLITVKQYLQVTDPTENLVRSKIDSLVNGIEWDWYRRGGQNVLYWHWSPRVNWAMNFPLRGWNETMITYVLAASSTTHTIPKEVYTQGFKTGLPYLNGQSYYGIPLPLGEALGGPLFFSHYSFLGLKPTQLQDGTVNFSTQTINHSKINHAYCVANPKKYIGYSADCWGLTASDNQDGYNAHSPTNDLGVITPTAALSSFPYTPTESMKAMKFFYYKLGDRLWGDYGFYDAFNPTADWYGRSYLAIDQGPIVVMMENYRTGLLWNLFMSAPEVQQGLTKLGFQY